MPLTAEKEILAAVDYWKTWGKRFGWVLYGCDDYDSASYFRDAADAGALFKITHAMRDDIDAALNAVKGSL